MAAMLPSCLYAQRIQQKLGRSVVAVAGSDNVLVTWRKLAQEPENCTYNLYMRKQGSSDYTKVNAEPIVNTNYQATVSTIPYGTELAVTMVSPDGTEGDKSSPFLFQSHAYNNVFMDITNKPDIYKGLEYDDNVSFAMHIVRRDGSAVLNPSSGEKHVLAISFLISLSLNTERLNPMMMDTPLSRLDVVHKKNIGTALSHLGNQVIFLAQPGEMDPETLRCFIPSVAKMFEAAPDEDNGACIMEVPL